MTVGAFDPELFARYRKARAGSPLRSALENRLVIENTPLVKTLVDQMLGRGEVKRRGKFGSQRQAFAAIDWDEAMQAGRIALMKAMQGVRPVEVEAELVPGLEGPLRAAVSHRARQEGRRARPGRRSRTNGGG